MRRILIIVGLIISGLVYGQQPETTDFLTEINKYDISELWTLTKLKIENDTTIVERQEPLGYIGDSFQRFYIHFISAIQNPTDKLKYFIYGKTRVKENICSFQGEIVIKEARIYVEGDIPPLKQGFVKGAYEFYENSKQKETGKLVGNFTTNFYIDEKGNFIYDALIFAADGFNNNQFEGIWTSYKSKETRKCNWGDYRIPDSKGLDCGAGEFSVVDKYASNGWIPYILEHMMNKKDISNSPEFPDSNDKWWK